MSETLHIVLIDDNPYDRELASHEIRRSMSVTITEVSNPEQWETAFAAGEFDLVVTDYDLHWSDGLSILRAVKARDPFCPVVMFTGTGTQEIAVEAMKAGLDDYVIKAPRHYVRLPVAVQGAAARAAAQRRLDELEAERARRLIEEQQARQRADFLAEASVVLSGSLDVATTLQQVAELAVPHIADWCGVYLAGPGQPIRLFAVAHQDPRRIAVAHELHERYPPDPQAPGGVGAVMRTGQPELTPQVGDALLVAAARDAEQLALWRAIGLHGTMTVPLVARGRTLGAISFVSSSEARRFSAEDLQLASELARRAALAVDNAQLYTAEQQARRRVATLEAVSTGLARSLDDAAALQQLAQLLVPALADSCVAYIQEPDGQVRRLARTHVDPAKLPIMDEIERRYPFNPEGTSLVARVLRSGEAMLIPPVNEELWVPSAPDADYVRLWQSLGAGWSIIAPLLAREQVVGALLVSTQRPERAYGDDDLQLMQEIARRAAVAIDNARLYQQAQAAIRVRDQFLSVAAHELKTPLTSLYGQAQLLQRRMLRDGGDERVLRSVEIITSQASRLNEMVLTLLDVTQLEQGRLGLNRQPLDLRVVLDQVVADVGPTLSRHTLRYEPPPTLLLVDGDAVRLEQVVQNLVINAVKYSPAGGTVTLEASAEAGGVVLTVRDEGIGIPAHELPHIFEQFYRAENVGKHHISGMGIGLYILHELVTLHGGTISVESEEGQGSSFSVRLPHREPQTLDKDVEA